MSSFLLFAMAAMAFAVMMQNLMHFEASYSSADIAKLSAGLTVVVTGANSGVGFASADHFVQAGTAKVIVMACRNVHKCDAARDKIVQKSPDSSTKIIPLQLDLANKTSIEDFASILPDRLREFMGEEEGDAIPPIDVLMNNAGIFASSPHKEFIEGIESHIWVNHLAHVLLTHLLWPNLVEGKGRVVTISSIAALLAFSPTDWWFEDHVDSFLEKWNPIHEGVRLYARSKRANLFFAHELHRRYSDISAVSSHPGYSRTEIWNNGAKFMPDWYAKGIQTNKYGSMSPADASLTQVWAAIDHQDIPSGWYVGPKWLVYGEPVAIGPIMNKLSAHYWPLSSDDSETLWDQSLKTLGIIEFGSVY